MSLRGSIGPTLRRLDVGALALGFAVTAVLVVATMALLALTGLIHPLFAPFLTFLGELVIFIAVSPLLIGIYAHVGRDDRVGSRAAVDVARSAVRDRYGTIAIAESVVLGLAVGAGLLAASLWFLFDTILRYLAHANGTAEPPDALGLFFPLLFVFLLGMALALLVLQFADLAVVVRDRRPRRAWRASLRFVRRHPLTFLGYAITSIGLLATAAFALTTLRPVLLGIVGLTSGNSGLAGTALSLAILLAIWTATLSVLATFRLTVYERTDVSDGRRSGLSVPSKRSITAVAVLLVAAVAGATFVRAADVGVDQQSPTTLPDDPAAAFDVAAENTLAANHRWVTTAENVSNASSEPRVADRIGVDYVDRQRYMYIFGSGGRSIAGYFSEATIATRSNDFLVGRSEFMAPLTRRVGNWTITAGNGYGLLRSVEYPLPAANADWTVETVNASTVVYRIDDFDRFRGADPPHVEDPPNLSAASYATAVVDRERGFLRTVTYRYEWTDTDTVQRYVRRFRDVGSADLKRPAAIGDRSVVGWVWDVLYY